MSWKQQIFRLSKWKYKSIQCHDHKSDQINLTGGFPTRVWAVEKKTNVVFNIKVIQSILLHLLVMDQLWQLLESIKSHNAYYGCERCLVHGRWEGRVVFDEICCNLCTNQSFINPEYHDHQIGKTPLDDSRIDCIMQFPLDYMHLICLVVMRLLLFWKEDSKPSRLAPFQINQISERLMPGLQD